MASDPSAPERKGIILFAGYPVRDLDILAGLDDPNVVGLEAVFEWKDLEPEEGKFQWAELDRALTLWHGRGKFIDLRVMTVNSNVNVTPEWVFRRHGVRRIADGSFSDFNTGADSWRPGNGASLTPGNPDGSIRLAAESAPAAINHTGPALDTGAVYTIQMDAEARPPHSVLVVEATSATGGPSAARRRVLSSTSGLRAVELPLGPFPDYQLRIVAEAGSFEIDNILLLKTSGISADNTALHEQWIVGPKTSISLTKDPLYGMVKSAWDGNDEALIARINTEKHILPIGRRIWVEFHFRAAKAGTFGVRHGTLKQDDPLENSGYQWQAKSGDEGWKGLWVSNPEGRTLEFFHIGPGAIDISDIRTSYKGERVTEFPDFFQPEFRAELREFIAALAERYGGHPALHAVAVMGNGRWEELMLDGDRPGVLDAQWQAVGYSQEKHVRMVNDSVGDIMHAFPRVKTQLQTAYGLKQVTDPGISYRRMGGMAANRGAMLKQNGMTERYDTWNEPGEPSWLFARYRHRADAVLVHESAGQICRNTLDVTGHPISYINRALSNGTDFYYLYEMDLNTRSVARYFDYAATMAGSGLFTNNYAVASRTILRQDVINHNPIFRNLWCGLRPIWVPPAPEAMWQQRDGEAVLVAWNNEQSLAFDLDDRARYDGLCGATFWIRSYLEPDARAAVEQYQESSGEWLRIGELSGVAGSLWQTREFALGNGLTSARNGGIDPYRDLRIRALAGTAPAVQAVAVNAVHARGWARRVVSKPQLNGTARRLDRVLSQRVTVPNGSLPTSLRIPIRAANKANWERLSVAVSAINSAGAPTPVAQRFYEFPNDGDWIEVEFPEAVIAAEIEVTLSYDRGPVGWCESTNGDLAVELESRIPQEPSPGAGAISTGNASGSMIDLWQPCEALLTTASIGDLRIERSLAGGEWAIIPHRTIASGTGTMILFEPQPPGLLRLTGVPPKALQIFPMQRREPLPDSLPRDPRRNVLRSTREADKNTVLTSDSESVAEWNLTQPISASPDQHLEFRLHNESASGLARVWWADKDQEFSPDRSCWIPLIPHDRTDRLYSDAVGMEASWSGRISRLRFDPWAASPRQGRIRISEVCVTEQLLPARVDFADEKHRLTTSANIASLDLTPQGQRITTVGGIGKLELPRSAVTVDANTSQRIVLRLRNDSDAALITLRWGSAMAAESGSYPLQMTPHGGVTEVQVETANLPAWSGTITKLTFEIPNIQPGQSLTFRELLIEKIREAKP